MVNVFYDDYYPLIPCTLDSRSWIAWQFDCPEKGGGVVQVFRRSESIYRTAEIRLSALDMAANYSISNLDAQRSEQVSGCELIEKGLPVDILGRSGAAVILYHAIKPHP